jgi:plastocyanin
MLRSAQRVTCIVAALAFCVLPRTMSGAGAALPVPGSAAGAAVAPAGAATEHAVTIEGFEFRPPLATVKVGDAVIWRNADLVPHTVSAKDAALDSAPIASGGTFRFTAKRKGRFDYICTLHPTMKATLVVE